MHKVVREVERQSTYWIGGSRFRIRSDMYDVWVARKVDTGWMTWGSRETQCMVAIASGLAVKNPPDHGKPQAHL